MKTFFNLKNLKIFFGFATGFIVYNYFANGDINWIRAIVTAILVVFIMTVYNIFKTSKS